jgi:hypothetical protein
MEINGTAAALTCLVGALLFAGASLMLLRYPAQVKCWKDNYALFEFQRNINRQFEVQHYRFAGWLLAFCACMMLVGAALAFV